MAYRSIYGIGTPVDISPPTLNDWVNRDLSAYLPAEATGAIIHVVNTASSGDYQWGVRKRNSTDDYKAYSNENTHLWVFVGLDDRFCQIYSKNADLVFWLEGYTTNGVTLHENWIPKTIPAYGAWTEVNFLGETAEGAEAVILRFYNSSTSYGKYVGARPKDCSLDLKAPLQKPTSATGSHTFLIVKLSEYQRAEIYATDSSITMQVVGYITQGVSFLDTPVEITPGSIGVWSDVQLDDNAGFGFVYVVPPTNYTYGARKNGSSQDIYRLGPYACFAAVATDDDHKIELKVSSLSCHLYKVGIGEEEPPVTAEFSASPLEDAVPFTVQFTDESFGGVPPYTYDWDFGDGSEHSSDQNPTHEYASPGLYTVTLTITDSDSPPVEDEEVKTNYIRANPSEVMCLIERVEITPTTPETWEDKDISSYVSDDATGALLQFVNTAAGVKDYGVRKKGSTDTILGKIEIDAQNWGFCGIDDNKILQAYIQGGVKVYLIGYTRFGISFLTNAVGKTPSALDWQDIDCSANVDSGTDGLLFLIKNTSESDLRVYGIRKNGSTDEYVEGQAGYVSIPAGNMHFVMIGCDTSYVCEGRLSQLGSFEFWLVGFVTQGINFFLNAVDKSLSGVGEYTDISLQSEAPTSSWMLTQVNCQSQAGKMVSLREKGSSNDFYHIVSYGAFKPQWLNTDHVCQGKIEHTDIKFWVVGYVICTTYTLMSVSGTVKLGAVAVEGAEVICFNKSRAVYIGKAETDSEGEYTFLNAGYKYELVHVGAHYIDDQEKRYGMVKQLELQ